MQGLGKYIKTGQMNDKVTIQILGDNMYNEERWIYDFSDLVLRFSFLTGLAMEDYYC
jgi:hypothetical protein